MFRLVNANCLSLITILNMPRSRRQFMPLFFLLLLSIQVLQVKNSVGKLRFARKQKENVKKKSISMRRAAITDFILAQETHSMLSSCAKLKKVNNAIQKKNSNT